MATTKKSYIKAKVDFAKEAPITTRASSLAEMTKEVLAKVEEEPGVWFRILSYPIESLSAAEQASRSLKAKRPEFRFKAQGGKVFAKYLNGQEG